MDSPRRLDLVSWIDTRLHEITVRQQHLLSSICPSDHPCARWLQLSQKRRTEADVGEGGAVTAYTRVAAVRVTPTLPVFIVTTKTLDRGSLCWNSRIYLWRCLTFCDRDISNSSSAGFMRVVPSWHAGRACVRAYSLARELVHNELSSPNPVAHLAVSGCRLREDHRVQVRLLETERRQIGNQSVSHTSAVSVHSRQTVEAAVQEQLCCAVTKFQTDGKVHHWRTHQACSVLAIAPP